MSGGYIHDEYLMMKTTPTPDVMDNRTTATLSSEDSDTEHEITRMMTPARCMDKSG
jgi:hypothetical protein